MLDNLAGVVVERASKVQRRLPGRQRPRVEAYYHRRLAWQYEVIMKREGNEQARRS